MPEHQQSSHKQPNNPEPRDGLKRAAMIVSIAVGLATFAGRAAEAVDAVLKPILG